jgi:hypothetical protein
LVMGGGGVMDYNTYLWGEGGGVFQNDTD